MKHFKLKDFFDLVFDTANVYDIYVDGFKSEFSATRYDIVKNHPDWLNLVIRKVIIRSGSGIIDISLLNNQSKKG